MRDVYPTTFHKREGFVELKVEINEEDLREMIETYLTEHHEFDFDEMVLVNKRPVNIWLHAKCRKYLDPDHPEEDDAWDEVEVVSEKLYEEEE